MDDILMKTITDTEQKTVCPYCGGESLDWNNPEWDVDDTYCFMQWNVFCHDCQRTFFIAEDYKCVERRIYGMESEKDEKDSD